MQTLHCITEVCQCKPCENRSVVHSAFVDIVYVNLRISRSTWHMRAWCWGVKLVCQRAGHHRIAGSQCEAPCLLLCMPRREMQIHNIILSTQVILEHVIINEGVEDSSEAFILRWEGALHIPGEGALYSRGGCSQVRGGRSRFVAGHSNLLGGNWAIIYVCRTSYGLWLDPILNSIDVNLGSIWCQLDTELNWWCFSIGSKSIWHWV